MQFDNLTRLGIGHVVSSRDFGDISPLFLNGIVEGKLAKEREGLISAITKKLGANFIITTTVAHGSAIAELSTLGLNAHKARKNNGAFSLSSYDGLLYIPGIKGFPEKPILAMPTADCPAVILVKTRKGKPMQIAALHAGRKPLLAGIINKGLEKLSGGKGKIVAAIMPGICGNCYEITPEGKEPDEQIKAFLKRFPPTTEEYSPAYSHGGRHVDLATIIRHELLANGVCGEDIETLPICSREDNRLFSRRKGDLTAEGPFQGQVQRNALLIQAPA